MNEVEQCIAEWADRNAKLQARCEALERERDEQIHERERYYQLWMQASEQVNDMKAERDALAAVIKQHNLCHDLHGKVGRAEFEEGCKRETIKEYGSCGWAEQLEALATAQGRYTWSNERPLSPGWYWWKNTRIALHHKQQVVRVYLRVGNPRVQFSDGYDAFVQDIDGEWAGPVLEPQQALAQGQTQKGE